MCKSSREDVNNTPGKTELSTKMCRELDSTHRVGVFWIGEGRRAGEGEGLREVQDDGGKVLGAESTRKRRLWSLGQGALSDVAPLQAVSPHSQIRSHLCANSAQGSRASPR